MLINAFCEIWPGDWTQFWSGLISGFISGLFTTIIGTLIGVFLPFYKQSKNERDNKRERAVNCLRDILDEIADIKNQLQKINDNSGLIYFYPIKTPVWDSLINTNETQLLSLLKNKDKTFDSQNFTKQIFQLYNLVNEYNSWWNIYTQGAVVGARNKDDLESIKKHIVRLKNMLLCENETDNQFLNSISYTSKMIEETLKSFENTKGGAK